MPRVQLTAAANDWQSFQIPQILESATGFGEMTLVHSGGSVSPLNPGSWILVHTATGEILVVSDEQYQAGLEPWVP
jgi:hypothetical protein